MLLSSCSFKNAVLRINLSEDYLVTQENYSLSANRNWQDSFQIKVFDDKLISYEGMKAKYKFQVNNYEARIQYSDTQYVVHSSAFGFDKSNMDRLRFYNELPKKKLQYKVKTIDNTLVFRNRFYDKKISITYNNDGSVKIIETEKDNKFYIEDSLVILIEPLFGVDHIFEKPNKLDAKNLKPSSNCDSIFPLGTVSGLSNLQENQKVVILYSYIGCPPCMVLKNELTEMVLNGVVDAEKIKIINIKDDSTAISNYIRAKKVPFEYLEINERCEMGTYPIIAGYNTEGDLGWYEVGYTNKVLKRIQKFLVE